MKVDWVIVLCISCIAMAFLPWSWARLGFALIIVLALLLDRSFEKQYLPKKRQ